LKPEKFRIYKKRVIAYRDVFKGNKMGLVGIIIIIIFIVMAVLAPILSLYGPTEPGKHARDVMAPPSKEHPFGTDHFGRDILARILYGTRASMIIGISAALISIIIGMIIGVASGYYGGIFGEILMRFTDFFLVLPFIALVIVLAAILGRSIINIILVIGITSWPTAARIIRSETLSLKKRSFVERARAIGSSDLHIILRHILPNVWPLAIANAVLTISVAILSESFLSFIGLGDPTIVSWGGMLSDAFNNNAMIIGAWWFVLLPGCALTLLSLGFAFLGHALDEVSNPRFREG
jgi:peptide/nickel transport system permease protein